MCTGIKLKAANGSTVNGRTLEFGVPIDVSIAAVPRGYAFKGSTPLGSGLSYQSNYAAIGAIAFGEPALMDGLNEKGLSVGTFYFPGCASYAKITAENQAKALSPIEFSNWLLTSFATLDEVKAALPHVVIAPTVSKEWGGIVPPFHYIVFDKNSKCLVIEPIDGQLISYDNPLGVFTNSPSFDWQMTNLRNYIHLTPYNVKPVELDGVVLNPLGQGSGMVGIPGDFTPPSRFVRAAIFSATAWRSANAEEAVFQAFHLLNQFDIPVGFARERQENGVVHSDYTQITVVRDPQNLTYYFKTYADQTIRLVDLQQVDFKGLSLKVFDTSCLKQNVEDISKSLNL